MTALNHFHKQHFIIIIIYYYIYYILCLVLCGKKMGFFSIILYAVLLCRVGGINIIQSTWIYSRESRTYEQNIIYICTLVILCFTGGRRRLLLLLLFHYYFFKKNNSPNCTTSTVTFSIDREYYVLLCTMLPLQR